MQNSTGLDAISDNKSAADRRELEKITVVLPPRLASALSEKSDFSEVCLSSCLIIQRICVIRSITLSL